MESIETFTDDERGLTARVCYDDLGHENPRKDFDNAWTLVGFRNPHREFGDEEIDLEGQTWIDCPKCEGKEGNDDCGECGGHGEVEATTVEQILKASYPDSHLIIPVQCYDHSLVRYYAGNPVTEHWDTGTAGVAIISEETLDKEWNGDEDKARECLDSELETYTEWCNGEIYYYVVEDADGEHLDSCGGFYGYSHVTDEAKSALKACGESVDQEAERVRYWAERDVETVA